MFDKLHQSPRKVNVMRINRTSVILVGSTVIIACFSVAAIGRSIRSTRATHPRTGQPIIVPGADGNGTLLFNGWRISPAGRHVFTGDMLLGGAISPDSSTLAIANCGYGPHALHLFDIATEKEIVKLPMGRSWNGIAWAPDGKR